MSHAPTTAQLLAHPQLLDRGLIDLDQLYPAYQHWMKENNYTVIKRLDELGVLDHYSDRLLTSGGYCNNLECWRVLAAAEVKWNTLPVDVQEKLKVLLEPVAEPVAEPLSISDNLD